MRYNSVIFGLILSGTTFAQNPIRINLNPKVEDDKLKKTQAIIPVYKFKGLDIEPYNNFGIVESKKTKSIPIKQMPAMADCNDTAYSFIYFSGADNDKNSGYLLTLIGNYSRKRTSTYFYIDKNNNLDFTDDGPRLEMPYMQDTLMVTLKNLMYPDSDYELKLSRIGYGKNYGYKNLVNDHYQKRSGTKIFTKINYCYREQRYNMCSADFKSLTDSFTIGIKDMNVNALYNDGEMDNIYIGPYNQEILSEDLIELKSNKKKTTFEWNEKRFMVNGIDPLGKWIEISEVKDAKITKKIKTGRKVPKFSFTTEMNIRYSLKDFKKKHIYLYFWNDDLACLAEDTIYLRKIQNEFGNRIQVIGMNYGDEPRSMRFFQQYYNIPWIIGMSNNEINKKYYVGNLPKGYWIGKCRRLKGRNYTPKMMYDKSVVKFGNK